MNICIEMCNQNFTSVYVQWIYSADIVLLICVVCILECFSFQLHILFMPKTVIVQIHTFL